MGVMMINWGRRKGTSVQKTRMRSLSKIFPFSWFAKSRQGSGSSGMGSGGRTVKHDVKKNLEKDVGLQQQKSCRAEKFYGEAEENFWRLSFGEEGFQGRKSSGGCSEKISDDLHNEMGLSPSTCRSCGSKGAKGVGQKENLIFSHMVLNLKKNGDSNRRAQTKRVSNGTRKGESGSFKVSRRDCNLTNKDYYQSSYSPIKVVNYPSAKGANMNIVEEKGAKSDPNIQNSNEKDTVEVKTVKRMQASTGIRLRSTRSSVPCQYHDRASTHSKFTRCEEDDLKLETPQVSVCDKLEELSLGHGEERNSIYISKDLLKTRSKSGRSSKVKVYSPRTPSKAELCKIRAFEDIKKTRMKMKVKREKKERALLESYVVVECSFDPQKDFRNSMLEMIIDKGISRPEELEELLTCYLTLNSDEYHDLIIKVFRQVWFDLNKDHLDPQLRG